MITIEILISIVILFLVISTSVVMIKHLHIIENQTHKYEKFYISFFNITNYLDNRICTDKYLKVEGNISDVSYIGTCKLLKEKRNFVKALEKDDKEGNIGSFLFLFYQVTLKLKWKKSEKTYIFYKTISKKVQ